MISNTNHRLPLLKCHAILCDIGLPKLTVEIEAVLDHLTNSFIAKNKQPVILDEDGSLSRQKIEVHLVVFASASVAFSHLWEEALQKQAIR